MEPLVISEKVVNLFRFWLDGQVHNGMRCQNELFRSLHSATSQQRQKIYDSAWALAQEGVQVVITVTTNQYTLWVSLRSFCQLEGWPRQQSASFSLEHS